MKTSILSLILAGVIVVGGYEVYSIFSGQPTPSDSNSTGAPSGDTNPAGQNSAGLESINPNIPATSTDANGNTISNTPDPRFGGDGYEDDDDGDDE